MRGLREIRVWLVGLFLLAPLSDALALELIGRQNNDAQAAAEYRLAAETFPYIVLVPGVLGSRIRVCPLGQPCDTVWGDLIPNFNSAALVYRPAVKYDVSLLKNIAFIKVYEPFVAFAEAEYGRFGLKDRIVTAPYDWRADVGRSAGQLDQAVCGILKKDPNAKIVFFAHSMGGLVLKQWMISYLPKKCGVGKIQILHAYFVATPHLGAAKTVGALVRGYNLFLDQRDPDIVQFFQRLGNAVFARAIDKSGLSFDGFFDLLPFLGSKDCHQYVSPTSVDIVASGPGGEIVDIYDADNWDTYSLLDGHVDPGGVQLALPGLRAKLASARKQVCELANFDPETVADTKYVVGVLPLRPGRADPTSTVSRVDLKVRNFKPEPEDRYSTGDGTVDARSASNKGIGTFAQRIITETSHIDAINSEAAKLLVGNIVTGGAQTVFEKLQAQESLSESYFVDRLSPQSALMPFDLDPGKWNEAANAKAIRINRQIFSRLQADPNNIYRENKERVHSVKKLLMMSLSAEFIDDNQLNKAGAFARAAETAFVIGDYGAAQNYGTRAIEVGQAIVPRNRQQGKDRSTILTGARNTVEAAQNKLTKE